MSENDWQEELDFDRAHIWHPYTSMVNPLRVYPVESADGVRITLRTGEQLIDGMSSWWSVIHGYNQANINDALRSQSEKLNHVMFGGLTHQPAIELCRKLVDMSPEGLDRVFLADSGSVSVEVAIKMAVQYWYKTGKAKKNRLLTVKGGYHGDTAACMSVCDPENGMHEMFTGILPQQYFAPRPACAFSETWKEEYINEFSELISEHADELAAVILEPIVQGAGGMYFYSPEYLKRVRQLCDEHEVLLILDEVATGFGRTGKLFACEWADVIPDILCVGKALTGGYLTLAATLTSEKIAKGISADGSGVLMHGPTFMANPLACACANASLDLLETSQWKAQVAEIESTMKSLLSPCENMETVEEVRVLGSIGVVELKNEVDMEKIQRAFVERGVWIRPFGKLVYIMPPYIICREDLEQLCETLVSVVSQPDLVF